MRRSLLLSLSLGGLFAAGLLLQQVAAADKVKTIDIVKNDAGKFVFSDTDAKIDAGQSIKWVAKDGDVAHQLVPDSDDDAFKDTGEFDGSNPPTQKFPKAATIKYHCAIHPKSMKGTITVAGAKEEPAEAKEEEEAPAPKKPAKTPSYGY